MDEREKRYPEERGFEDGMGDKVVFRGEPGGGLSVLVDESRSTAPVVGRVHCVILREQDVARLQRYFGEPERIAALATALERLMKRINQLGGDPWEDVEMLTLKHLAERALAGIPVWVTR